MLKDYATVVVGTDGSDLAGPTVTRAAWIADQGRRRSCHRVRLRRRLPAG